MSLEDEGSEEGEQRRPLGSHLANKERYLISQKMLLFEKIVQSSFLSFFSY